ncbi:MAG: response regulator [Nitrosopumilus sp.]|nr:response regulator [Nitrosopumilus sp.]
MLNQQKVISNKNLFNMYNKEIVMNKRNIILLIDDNPINLKISSIQLKDLGFNDIVIAKNALEALELMDESISLVLLDIGLPDINGLDLCTMLRKKVNYKKLPIIAVTAFTDNIHEKCTLADIDDVINKPVDMNILSATLINNLVISKDNE